MFSTHDAGWWWPALMLLAPVALAARRKPKREREPPRKPPPPRFSWGFPLLAVGLAVATVVVVSALRGGFSQEAPNSGGTTPGAPDSELSPEERAGVVAEQWKAMASVVCPRFAAFQQGDAGIPSARV